MCLIVFSIDANPTYKLVVASNRDEYYERPTAKAKFWEDEPEVLAGRDLMKGGTWLGLTKTGRFAAVTNYRGLSKKFNPVMKRTRGELVRDFLTGVETNSQEYMKTLRRRREEYDGYNLIFGDACGGLFYYCNVSDVGYKLKPGLYGLSNAYLDTPWFKLEKSKAAMSVLMENSYIDRATAFEFMSDMTKAPDEKLPQTGVEPDFERYLSPVFIPGTDYGYGTRSTTVVLLGRDGSAGYYERSYGPGHTLEGEVSFEFEVEQ